MWKHLAFPEKTLLQTFEPIYQTGRMGYGDVQTPAAKERKRISKIEIHQYVMLLLSTFLKRGNKPDF